MSTVQSSWKNWLNYCPCSFDIPCAMCMSPLRYSDLTTTTGCAIPVPLQLQRQLQLSQSDNNTTNMMMMMMMKKKTKRWRKKKETRRMKPLMIAPDSASVPIKGPSLSWRSLVSTIRSIPMRLPNLHRTGSVPRPAGTMLFQVRSTWTVYPLSLHPMLIPWLTVLSCMFDRPGLLAVHASCILKPPTSAHLQTESCPNPPGWIHHHRVTDGWIEL